MGVAYLTPSGTQRLETKLAVRTTGENWLFIGVLFLSSTKYKKKGRGG
jgi:hypothetical protein